MDNSITFKMWELFRRLLIIVFFVFVACVFLWKQMPQWFLYIGISISALCVFVWIYTILAELTYFSYRKNENTLEFKYSKADILNNARKKIMLPANSLSKATIQKSGLKKELIINQSTKNGVAAYPPMNITFVRNTDVARMMAELESLVIK